MRHKKDAIESGVGGFPTEESATTKTAKIKSGFRSDEGQGRFGARLESYSEGGKGPSGASEAEEFKTRWEMSSQEEVERREIERERAGRCVTS